MLTSVRQNAWSPPIPSNVESRTPETGDSTACCCCCLRVRMRGASPEVGQETPQPDDNLRQSTGFPRGSTPPTTTVDNQGVLDRQKEREENTKYDNVSYYVLARTIHSNLHEEAAKLIGCTGMGKQCKRGQCFARAMQMFHGKGMDRIPTEVVLALLRQ
ncbi:unnamed protein product [Pylaiella littoralis]